MKAYILLLGLLTPVVLFAENQLETAEAVDGPDEEVDSIENYPIEVIDRPGILPIGMFEFLLRAGSNAKFNPVNLKFGVSAGLAPFYQLGVSYDGIDVYPLDVKRIITMHNRIKIGTWQPFTTSLELDIPFHIASGEIVRSFDIGMPLTFFNERMAGGFLNDGLLTINMRPEIGVGFNFNAWYGVQGGSHFWGELGLNLATVNYQQDEWKATPYWETPNVKLLLLWAWTNWFDTAIILKADDFRNFVDTFSYSLSFSFRGGVF